MTFKQKVYQQYLQLINDNINRLQLILNDLKEIGSNETKSTAGDKHETALAMIQIEQANLRTQLKDANEKKERFFNLKPTLVANKVSFGSLVKTNRGYIYISVALGKQVVNGIEIFAISSQSPLGQQLLGLTILQTVQINGNKYIIENIE